MSPTSSPRHPKSNRLPSEARTRGGQPGNINALKHGFYAQQYLKADLASLDQASTVGVQDEIAMLRIYLRRLLMTSQQPQDILAAASVLRTITLAATAINRLIRTQFWISSNQENEVMQTIQQAIEEFTIEFGLDSNADPPGGVSHLGDDNTSKPSVNDFRLSSDD
jgi:hypothetical protein